MSLIYLQLLEDRRRIAIEECAARQQISPVIIEKDFWVCWVLLILFRSRFANDIVFKGGTSLSKVFHAVDRFSEDIDLSLSPEFLNLPVPGSSRNQANKWMTLAEKTCIDVVRDSIRPELDRLMESDLIAAGIKFIREEHLVFEIDPQSNSPVLLFYYPSMLPAGLDYLKRSVKLEFGSLTEQRPIGRHPVSPWLASTFPQAFPDWSCEVIALEIERTFWEKATILHAEFYRPENRATPDRFSRHYADTVALAEHPDGQRARAMDSVRAKVVDWKSRFFGSSWARYDLAVPGSFRLVPPESRMDALRQDYQAMRDMYLTEPLSFNEVIQKLTILEAEINRNALWN